MTHDSTPYLIFKIDELTRLIASQLILIDGNAVNLARVCRSLEEPVLSTLWEIKPRSLHTLLKVLPKETWKLQCPRFNRYVVCDFDPPVGRIESLSPRLL